MSKPYIASMTRRQTLKWMGKLAASAAAFPLISGCGDLTDKPSLSGEHWPSLNLTPITGAGYGKDPNLIIVPSSPWPLTLSNDQLQLVASLCDMLIPAEGNIPSATSLGVPDVVNEWVSAPYPNQQNDRDVLLHAFAWIDDEARLRFDKTFVKLNSQQQAQILDDIAYQNAQTKPQFQRIAKAFNRFSRLALAAFFCTDEGSKDLGYMGNVAISGEYPGPSNEAKAHLDSMLHDLGLTEYAFDEGLD
ncbi:gluconate 2-dehydrogenase subunit 3 family protein [Thalassotalea agarivorans]|uniref:Gluconate 2-dehydrogenase subunit 3 n=1 Tax=Thalassotalea agarivorans TaxID=349064 RepID=A0A1H9Y7F0_THASX|nr:gluconate 2-dehydrogenase subunit 3 family protein [Thalassotalea agarivorans]SES64849.1 Gluconate 2-dehydrogenase subunit 3 [Thalassotalea agarivorans]